MNMTADPARHAITRERRDIRRRTLTVTAVEQVTPGMRRVHLTSPDLRDFISPSADDHMKLIFPAPAGAMPGGAMPGGETVMRDYTPRRFDAAAGTLALDFALHGGGASSASDIGPATAWALRARPGDTLDVAGPRGSLLVPDDFDWVLLIGDETALPAIGRRVEALRPGVPVTTIVVVNGAAERQVFATAADWRPVWVEREGRAGDDAAPLLGALADHAPPAGEGYVWIAAEARVARALRAHVSAAWHHPEEWLRSSGYWVRGEPGAHE